MSFLNRITPKALTAIFTVALSGTVFLAPSVGWSKAKAKAADPSTTDIYAPVPTPEIDFNRYQVPPSIRSQYHLEVNLSSWSPNNFSDNSFIAASSYKSSGMPKLDANIWSGAWNYKSVTIAPKFGLSYVQLERNGSLGLYNQNLNVTEVMNLYSVRFGAELTPQSDFFGFVQPFMSVSLLPTWAQSPQNALNEGSSSGYVNLEEIAGVNFHIRQLGAFLGVANAGLEIGLEGTQGIGGSPLSGIGLLAGTRIEL